MTNSSHSSGSSSSEDSRKNSRKSSKKGRSRSHRKSKKNKKPKREHIWEPPTNIIEIPILEDYAPIHLAAMQGDKPKLVEIWEQESSKDKQKKIVNLQCKTDKQRPLHLAASHGHLSIVHALMNRGADRTSFDKLGHTPLSKAAYYGQYHVVDLFISREVPLKLDRKKQTPLHHLARNCNLQNGLKETVDILIRPPKITKKEKVSNEDNDFDDDLNNDFNDIDMGTSNFIDLNAIDSSNVTPVHVAVQEDNVDFVSYLISLECDLNISDIKGNTILHTATKYASIKTLKFLIESHLDLVESLINNVDENGWTPLHVASSGGEETKRRLILKKELLKEKAEKAEARRLKKEQIAIRQAKKKSESENGSVDNNTILKKNSMDSKDSKSPSSKEKKNKKKNKKSKSEAEKSKEEEKEEGKEEKSSKEESNKESKEQSNQDSKEESSQDKESKEEKKKRKENDESDSTISTLSSSGSESRNIDDELKGENEEDSFIPETLECLDLLLNIPTLEVNLRDTKGRTALHIATKSCVPKLVSKLLLKGNADSNIQDNSRKTALQYGIRDNQDSICSMLVNSGADVSLRYTYGTIPTLSSSDRQQLYNDANNFGYINKSTQKAKVDNFFSEIENEKRNKIMKREVEWTEILGKWDTIQDEKKYKKKIKKLIKKGMPESVRTKGWKLLVGGDKLRNDPKNRKKYRELVQSDVVDRKITKQIDLDVKRTERNHVLFKQRYGPGQRCIFRALNDRLSLFNVLKAYAAYDPEVGYCQGMSGIGALLLMYMEEEDAFWALLNLMSDPKWYLRGQFEPKMGSMMKHFSVHDQLLKSTIPKLSAHFEQQGITSNLYATKWYIAIFLDILPTQIVLRIWDIFLYAGYNFVYTIAIGLLKMFEDDFLSQTFDNVVVGAMAAFENKTVDPDTFFKFIFKTSKNKLKPKIISEALQTYQDSLEKTEG